MMQTHKNLTEIFFSKIKKIITIHFVWQPQVPSFKYLAYIILPQITHTISMTIYLPFIVRLKVLSSNYKIDEHHF